METSRCASFGNRACAIRLSFVLFSAGSIACGGGDTPSQPTGRDSVSTVVGPAGGLVTTPSGEAGVQIPAGALGQQVTVTVTRLPTPASPSQGPLPTSLNQYGPFYEIAVSPANAQLGDSVRVGVCQVTDVASPFYAPEATHGRLRLAHTVGVATEILERVGVNDFLRCTGVTADGGGINPGSSRWARAVASVRRGAAGLLYPRALYAAHGGLGGKVKSFSPFGAVDPLTGLVVGAEFGLATTAAEEDFGDAAYDGTNYLLTLERIDAPGQHVVEAQLVSANGSLVGGRISLPGGPGGGGSKVAFDGTNYLVVWESNVGPVVLGQFVSKAGTLVGSAFTVVPFGPAFPSELAFGGGTYFLSYVRSVAPNGGEFQYTAFGRLISPAGVVGAQLALTAGRSGDGFNNVAFDGARFLSVYTDGASVKGRFVSSAGVLGSETTIIPSGSFVSNVAVGFNGTNYLVTIASGQQTFDAVAQLVSPSGTRIGGLISVISVPGADEVPVGVVASGNNFIVSYVDSLPVLGATAAKARFISETGAPRGPAFGIASPRDGTVVIGLIVGFDGAKYLAVLRRGVQNATDPAETNLWTQSNVYGVLITVPVPPGS